MTAERFLEEFTHLLAQHPRGTSRSWDSENCDLSDQVFYSKNLQYCFDCVNSEDSLYLYDSYMTIRSVDCDYAVESELCYESVDPYNCFNCDYVSYCSHVTDSYYSYDCRNCHDIFGCAS